MVEQIEREMIDRYAYQIEVVLGVLNSPEAPISDNTTVGDMIATDEPDIDKARLTELADTFNCDVGMSTPLWELARAICWEEALDAEHNGQT